jgi:hypothetical protein
MFLQHWFLVNDHLLDQPNDDLDDVLTKLLKENKLIRNERTHDGFHL